VFLLTFFLRLFVGLCTRTDIFLSFVLLASLKQLHVINWSLGTTTTIIFQYKVLTIDLVVIFLKINLDMFTDNQLPIVFFNQFERVPWASKWLGFTMKALAVHPMHPDGIFSPELDEVWWTSLIKKNFQWCPVMFFLQLIGFCNGLLFCFWISKSLPLKVFSTSMWPC
jgi:hypothetical protein